MKALRGGTRGITYLRFSPFAVSLNEGGRFACFHLSSPKFVCSHWYLYVWIQLFGYEFRWHNGNRSFVGVGLRRVS